MHILFLTLTASLAINLALFAVAFKLQSDKLTDISYAVSFAVLAAIGILHAPNVSSYLIAGTALVLAWTLRIGGYLLYRVIKAGKDKRFDTIRQDFWKFSRFWIGQALTVWLLMIPLSLATNRPPHWTVIAAISIVVWALGIIIETVADIQKYQFTHNHANKGRWIDNGLWHYSRHPNYYGEILVWTGIYLFAFPALNGQQQLIGLVSPLGITLLLRFISGVPVLEKSADRRWGSDTQYQEYKRTTNLLIIGPKK